MLQKFNIQYSTEKKSNCTLFELKCEDDIIYLLEGQKLRKIQLIGKLHNRITNF